MDIGVTRRGIARFFAPLTLAVAPERLVLAKRSEPETKAASVWPDECQTAGGHACAKFRGCIVPGTCPYGGLIYKKPIGHLVDTAISDGRFTPAPAREVQNPTAI